jgi:hypothetical protein
VKPELALDLVDPRIIRNYHALQAQNEPVRHRFELAARDLDPSTALRVEYLNFAFGQNAPKAGFLMRGSEFA